LADAAHEALTNVVKHAGVDRAVVRAATVDDGTRVTVRDHGQGFDPAAVQADATGARFGVRQSIKARMADAGGTAVVDSSPGRGTRVELWVPA
jgi:signal transduction histidine kinase